MPKAILKPANEVALLLTLKPARTEQGRKVQQAALFRVEVGMWISDALKGE